MVKPLENIKAEQIQKFYWKNITCQHDAHPINCHKQRSSIHK